MRDAVSRDLAKLTPEKQEQVKKLKQELDGVFFEKENKGNVATTA